MAASGVLGGGSAPALPRSPIDIATDHCKGCELCISACPKHVLELDRDAVNRLGHHPIRLVDAARCTSCALCARVCPDVVFTIYRRES
ncbi:MAG TPA: 4Fe-4S dicluster domain-containing protein [Candidatus Limnocylindrales bacterium]|nr:4Fe-4S dicluster domain-containing protein [Candidatus Limnocylindrales bacterium]